MTNGGRHTALRARMARSNPPTAQYPRDPMGGGAAQRDGEQPARAQRPVHAGEQRGPFRGPEVSRAPRS